MGLSDWIGRLNQRQSKDKEATSHTYEKSHKANDLQTSANTNQSSSSAALDEASENDNRPICLPFVSFTQLHTLGIMITVAARRRWWPLLVENVNDHQSHLN